MKTLLEITNKSGEKYEEEFSGNPEILKDALAMMQYIRERIKANPYIAKIEFVSKQ